MRLDKVRFRNINSLAGTWTVDFNDPDLADNGLFLITGKTGAGKSTLLDAVSIALYSCTPRLGRLVQTDNEVMTRNTGECWSEVEFTTAKGRYRSTWSQQRARKKAGGRLQQPAMKLVRLLPDGEEEGLADKVKEAREAVEQITGMTFENFTRSMLLAQGRFAQFLQAGESERSALLERITGTQIYSDLSVMAHKKERASFQAHQEAVQALAGIQLLTDEERRACGLRLAELAKDLETAAEERRGFEERLSLLHQREQAGAKVLRAREAARQAQDAHAALQPLRQALVRDDRAARLDACLSGLRQARTALGQAEQNRAALAADLPVKEEAERAARALEAERESQAQKRAQALADLAPVLQQARDLDSRLELAAGERDRAARTRKGQAAALAAHGKKVKAQTAARRTCEQRLTAAADSLARSARDAGLAGSLSGLEAMHAALLEKRERAKTLLTAHETCVTAHTQAENASARAAGQDKKAEAAEAKAREAVESLAHDRDDLMGDLTLEDAQALADAAQDTGVALDAWIAALDQETAVLEERDSKRADLDGRVSEQDRLAQDCERLGGTHRDLEEKVALLRELVAQQRLIAGLEEHRARLRPGEPCPCCGSTEHPWSTGVPVCSAREEDLRRAEKDLKAAARDESRARQDLARCAGLVKADETALAALETRLRDAGAHAAGLLDRAAPLCLALEDRAAQAHALVRALRAAAGAWSVIVIAVRAGAGAGTMREAMSDAATGLRQARDQLTRLVKDLTALDRKIGTARDTLQKKEKARLEAASALAQARIKCETARDALTKAAAGAEQAGREADAADTAFAAALEPMGLAASAKDENILTVLRQRLQARRDAEAAHERLSRELEQLKSDEQLLAVSGEQLRTALAAADTELAAREQAHSDLAAERQHVLGGRPASDMEREARDAAQDAARARDAARAARESAVTALERVRTSLEAAAEQETRAREAADLSLAEARRQCRERGFADLDEASAARMSEDVRTAAEARVSAAADALTRTASVLTEAEAEERRLAGGPQEFLSQEELEAKRLAADEKAGQVQRESGALEQRLASDREGRTRHAEQAARCEELLAVHDGWSRLSRLIGSADGKRFRVFAQALTFARLVEQANRELAILNDRYTLVQDSDEPLELLVRDSCMGSETRSIRNLSGGETFQVSLALALGLASFSNRESPLETMFLDEGFGTLDPEALDKAVDTLASLRQRKDGALIGIISHVEALEERIPTRLHLRRGGDGLSMLTGPGCSRG